MYGFACIQYACDGMLGSISQAADKLQHLDQVSMMIEECEGLDKIEALQQHHNGDVYRLALSIIDKYFSEASRVHLVSFVPLCPLHPFFGGPTDCPM